MKACAHLREVFRNRTSRCSCGGVGRRVKPLDSETDERQIPGQNIEHLSVLCRVNRFMMSRKRETT